MKLIAHFLLKISTLLRRVGNALLSDKKRKALLKKWKKLDAEKQYRTNYPKLNSNSIVFDLGGYQGQWASDIYARYVCKIFVFEPHPDYVQKIKKRFEKNEQIKIMDFGLGEKQEQLMLSTEKESSSVYSNGKNKVGINIKEAEVFIQSEDIEWIDLMKINIEGGEYNLLDHLIKTGRIEKIKNLQIQFHHFVPEAEQLMKELHERLAKTHETTYFYKYFWENWRLKE